MKNGFKKRLSALCAVMMIMTSYPTTLVADEEVIPPEVRAEVPAEVPAEGAADLPEEGRAEDPAQPQAETPAENVVKIQLETSSGTPEGEAQAEPQNPLKEIQPGQSLDGSLDAGGEYRARLRVTSVDTLALATSGNLSVRLKVVNETTNAAKTFAPESGTKEIHASWQAAPGTYLLVFTAVNPAEGGSFRFSVKKEETADEQTEEKEEEKEEEPSAPAETANESGDDTVPELPAGNQDEQPAADAGSTGIPETPDTPETPDETVRQDDAGKDEDTPGNTTNEETEPESNQETTGKQNTEDETPEAQTGADRPEKQDEPENQVQPEGKTAEEGQGQEQEQTNEEKTAAGEEETVKGEQSPEEQAETNEPDETGDQTDEEPKEEPGQKTEAENRQEAGENQQPEEIFLGTQDVVVSYDVDVSAAAQLIPAPGTAKSPAKSRKLMAVRSAAPARSKTEYVGLDIAPAGQISAAGNALYHVDVALADPIDMLAGEEDVQVSGSSVALYHIVDGTPVQVNAEFTKSGDGRSITGFSFVTDGFSPYIVAYTVEFRYEDKVFELNVPGAKDILLSDILRELEILGEGNEADFMAQVAEVSVSDPDAFSLAYSEGDWTFRVLRETENPESLTVQTQNGRKYVVTLAATGITEVETEDGKATIHTVNGWYLPEGTDAYAEALTSEQGEAAVQAVKAANEALNDETGFQVFSVGLEDVDTDTYEGFNIDLRLQETVAGKDFHLYQVKDGKAEDITATLRLEGEEYESGRRDLTKYSFTTDSFAEYVLCYSLITYYTAFDGTTFRIALNYGPEAEIPEDAELDVQEILPENENYATLFNLAAGTETENNTALQEKYARFFDIEIHADNQKIEPKSTVTVTISLADLPDFSAGTLRIVHFDNKNGLSVMNAEINENADVCFEAESFSVYGVIVDPLPVTVSNLEGKRCTISIGGKYITYEELDGDSENPKRLAHTDKSDSDPYKDKVAKWGFESAGTDGEYYLCTWADGWYKKYLQMTKASFGADTKLTDESNRTKFSVKYDNGKYLISTKINNSDYYLIKWKGDQGTGFAGYTIEAINDAKMTFSFDQYSPGVDDRYAVIIRNPSTDQYFAVQNDGHLAEVEYSFEDNKAKVKMEYPLLWNYTFAYDGLSDDTIAYNEAEAYPDQEPHNLRIVADARGYDEGTQLASGSYFRYISPAADSGIAEENKDNPSHNAAKISNGLKYAGHNLFNSAGKYIGVDFEAMRITGNKDADAAATVYLAKVDTIPSWKSNNETVSHIDIAIEGEGMLDVPLAYGSYYDASGELILEVSSDNEVTLHLTKKVDINKEDIMRASVRAFDKNGTELTDAFYITGYSANKQTEHSAVQVRMEGAFKVDTLGQYTGEGRSNQNETRKQERLNNQVYYRISVVKDVPFDMVYEGKQLYDKNKKPLTVSTKVGMSAGFSYWDPGNECPPLLADFEEKYSFLYNDHQDQKPGTNNLDWKSGAIIDNDWSGDYFRPGDSGMDFKLGNKEDSQGKTLAVEIVKIVEDENGERIHPADDITSRFSVFYNKNGNPDSVKGYAVPPNSVLSTAIDYAGYDPFRNQEVEVGRGGIGVLYDYDVQPGMYYVAENTSNLIGDGKNAIITDQDGTKWGYKETRIETEYAWRNTGDEGKRHLAIGDSAVPEVLGAYKDDAGNDQGNGFLEFYVHNIYTILGGLRITKTITVNGNKITGDTGDELKEKTNGTYTFLVKSGDDTSGTPISPVVEKVVSIAYTNGIITNATIKDVDSATEETIAADSDGYYTIDKLIPGTYMVTETDTDANRAVVFDRIISEAPTNEKTVIMTVAGGQTIGGKATAVFVNDYPTTSVTVEKVWDDGDDLGDVRPEKIEVQLYADETVYGNPVELPQDKSGTKEWSFTWEDLDSKASGETITYTVKEVGENNGRIRFGNAEYIVTVSGDAEDGFTITNYQPHKKENAPYVGTGTLGGVKVGEEITYELSYKNYKEEKANITITDNLDQNVSYVSASTPGQYTADGRKVTWNLANVDAGTSGTVTLTVKVLESALTAGEVINKDATVRVGNDRTFTLETVKNPVPEPPHKKETAPYVGTGTLGGVKVGDTITYEISYKNYKAEAANVTIKDQLDANVQFVSATDSGTESSGVVTWNLANVDAGKSGTVTLTVKVLEGALASKNGPGKIVNGGETATVQVGNDHTFTLDTVENPVPEEPHKKETAPYVGTGTLGGVKVGETITYEISYKNYKAEVANIVINDQLDEHVDYVSSSAPGQYTADGRKVTWNLANVDAGTSGTVTLTVKVLESALTPGKVINKDATVRVGNDRTFTLETVKNPVPEPPHKKETAPYVGTGTLGGVKIGDTITYEISYKNYKAEAANVTIKDQLDANVQFVSATDSGTEASGVVTWNLANVDAGTSGTVTLTVKVLEGALASKSGPGKVVNGGETATVQVGNDHTFTLDTVENPVPEEPHKKETAPYVGTGTLGGVKVGETITYEISYKNYKDGPAKVTISDTLDEHVEFVGANPTATRENKVVTWNLADVPAGGSGTVTLKVKALESAKASKDGPGVVINTGATVRVGNDHTFTLETVENPVPEEPIKKETAPYVGTGTLDGVKVGDVITYEIGYQNYKKQKADITIRDTLDEHVKFISADNGGVNTNGIVTWTVRNAEPGSKGTVTLRVEVLPGAQAPAGPGKVVNGGESAGVKVGNDHEFTLNEVENPVPEPPHKQESAPYEGTGVLGVVKVGDTITYDISYKNYKTEAANIVINDTLDEHVQFVSASEPGTYTANGHKVTWNLANVVAGTNGTVTLKVKVLESAEIPRGPGMVVNGGDTATVKIGNDHEYTLEKVTNPVVPNKQETAPYEGLGELGAVKVGETITYQINYVNFTGTRTTVVIKDKLDQNVEYVSSEPTGSHEHSGGTSGGTVTFTINDVAAGAKGSVTLTVKVLEGALASKEGPGKVANGPASVIKVGDQPEINLNTVENPVPEPPEKKEITPYQGTGTLGGVKAGEEITYRIQFRNYKNVEADINIADQLDKHVEFVSASDQGWNDNGTIRWTLKNYAANTDGSVTLTVKVLESALESRQGPGNVVNGGDTATLQVGDDHEFTLNTVENPVTDPHKKETAPYVGTGTLGGVKVGETITYEISYKNYKAEAANIVINDELDAHVDYVSSSVPGTYTADGRKVTWNLANVDAGTSGTVTLTVKVLESALTPGEVINKDATVRVGNDRTFTLETVKNPVPEPPHKKETAPYVGTGTLGGVKVGETITYEISYKNYKAEAANIVINDQLDEHVDYVSSSAPGTYTADGRKVTWNLTDVAGGTKGTVTLTVKVLEGALASKSGPGKVVNGGETATVQVGNDHAFTLETVENPVEEEPHKKETAPYVGTGTLGGVKVGETITYDIGYTNYKAATATLTIQDTLDANVLFVNASNPGTYTADGHKVTWNLTDVAGGTKGTVTLTVKVLEGALTPGEVINKDATVRVGNDRTFTLETVKNPVPEPPHKKETAPYVGTGTLGGVKVGETITYEISYKNYKAEAANIVINDQLDEHVDYVSSSAPGTYTADGRKVTWNLANVDAGTSGTVTLTVKVLEGALASKSGPGKVVNGGETATVQVGNDHAFTLETVENPVEEEPHKQETGVTRDGQNLTGNYAGTGTLGGVKVGDEITYGISYTNYKAATATLTIRDTLDSNVEYVASDPEGSHSNGVVTWNLTNVGAGQKGTVTLTVKVLEGATESGKGPGKVANEGATVRVGDDHEFILETVENPVADPHKKETAPYEGNGVLGGVKAGDEITYEISYKNYKAEAATVTIQDKLDANVQFVSAAKPGYYNRNDHKVTWTLANVAAGTSGTVTLTVKVLEGALASRSGPGKVVNGGETATVQVGDDPAVTLETVENPLPEPHKKETEPYDGTGVLGGVKVGGEITYEISYRNYKDEAATVTIRDELDTNVQFVSASDKGAEANGVVTWTLADVPAGKEGTVELTVKVLEDALTPGKVVNSGATVKVGNDHEFTLETVENPVTEPHKRETKPYEGNGVLGGVKVGDEITYEISYRNYNDKAATVTIRDKLDQNVSFVSADNGGKLSNGVVTWTLANVRAGRSGKVTLTVKVLESALASGNGPGKVVNDGRTATVQVGNDNEMTLETVENPVPEEPHKKETKPYEGNGVLGGVKVGDEITYEISYRNYKGGMADVVIRDKLDPNVLFVSASNGGKHSNGVVAWTLPKVAAGASGKVILTVKVLEGALASKKGPGKVVNGGGTATVKVGNDQEFTLETVENPVEAEKPTATPTAKPTATPTLTPKPTATPTPKPTTKPSTKPTATPTAKPTTKPGGGGGGGTKPTATPTATPEPETVSVTIKKVWDDENNIAGTRPASIRVTLSNGTSYTLNAGNKWTVTVNDLPALDEDGEEILYTWTEQRVKGYRQSTVVNGNETTITNTFRLPPSLAPGGGGSLKVLEDYETPLGLNAIINHVGDCFE